jgi:magnesium transporter
MVGDIADHQVISVNAETDQEECARLMERYDLSQLPVVGQDGLLTGVILAEDMVDVVEEEATEDMYRMAGVAGERVMGPLGNSLRRRLPWLYINLATALLAALVISIFESTIARVVVLAAFLPVVAGQGGIGGTQTVTLIVRSMALGEVPRQIGLRVLLRELALGLINGATLGVVVGVVAYLWKGIPMLGLVLGLAMLGNMFVAGLAGAGVPLLLRRLHMDPAVSSAVFVTTFTDVIGFLLFLGLAAAFISYLE